MATLEIHLLKEEPNQSIHHWTSVDDAVCYHALSAKWRNDEETLNKLQRALSKYDVSIEIEEWDGELVIVIKGREEELERIVDELELPSQWVSDYCYGDVISNGFVAIGSITYYCLFPDIHNGNYLEEERCVS